MFTIGILGGMGPMATVDLFTKIIECTPAKCDQEHLKVVVYNNPQIPSRVSAIMEGGESPLPELIRSAKLLEKAGADFIIMPCNTAHYWHNKLQAAIKINVLNMIENTADYIERQQIYQHKHPIMLFATAATVKTGIYQEKFFSRKLQLEVPNQSEQKVLSKAIDHVKAGHIEENRYLADIVEIMDRYCGKEITSFIAGCTEIPLLYKYMPGRFDKIDPTLLLAKEAVRLALGDLPGSQQLVKLTRR